MREVGGEADGVGRWRTVMGTEPIDARVARLSKGQLQVLRMVAQHRSSKEIAVSLGISSHTVDQRVRGAMRVLGVDSRWNAARLVADEPDADAYQRLIHQTSDIDAVRHPPETDGAIGYQIRHADRAKGDGALGLQTEQSSGMLRSSLVLPWTTKTNPTNALSVAQRLFWILAIAMGSALCAGMYLAGLESLARLADS